VHYLIDDILEALTLGGMGGQMGHAFLKG